MKRKRRTGEGLAQILRLDLAPYKMTKENGRGELAWDATGFSCSE
jgi:hypothetical protein